MGSDSGLSRRSGCPQLCEAAAPRWQNRAGCQSRKVPLIQRNGKESACQTCSAGGGGGGKGGRVVEVAESNLPAPSSAAAVCSLLAERDAALSAGCLWLSPVSLSGLEGQCFRTTCYIGESGAPLRAPQSHPAIMFPLHLHSGHMLSRLSPVGLITR